MAASTTTKVLYFDTAAQSITGAQQITGIFWTGIEGSEIATDNDFKLSDSKGNVIISKRAKAATDGIEITLCHKLTVDGIVVTAIDSGICTIFIA